MENIGRNIHSFVDWLMSNYSGDASSNQIRRVRVLCYGVMFAIPISTLFLLNHLVTRGPTDVSTIASGVSTFLLILSPTILKITGSPYKAFCVALAVVAFGPFAGALNKSGLVGYGPIFLTVLPIAAALLLDGKAIGLFTIPDIK